MGKNNNFIIIIIINLTGHLKSILKFKNNK